MRILVYSHSSVESKAGGGLSAFRFARYLSQSGRDVVQMAPNTTPSHPWAEVVDGLRIRRIPYDNRTRILKVLFLPLMMAGAVPHVRKCDVLLIYGPIPGYGTLIIVAKTLGKRVIYRSTVMGQSDVESLIDKAWMPSIRKRVLGRVDTYFAMHPAFTAAWVRTFGNDRQVIETAQGVDTDQYAPVSAARRRELRIALGIEVDALVILSVGFVIKRKGYHKSFEVLSKIEEDFQYIVVGVYEPDNHSTSAHRDEMASLVEAGRRGLGPRLRLTGPRDDVSDFMGAADIFLLNSSVEGLPNVLLEAMASGMCCVVSRLDGVDGYLTFNGENAEVFEGQNEMAATLKRVLTSPERRQMLGDNAAKFMREHFSYEAVARLLFGAL